MHGVVICPTGLRWFQVAQGPCSAALSSMRRPRTLRSVRLH